jgi:hypothetical protein
MKELINYMADPIRSFPITTILFVFMMKYYRIIGTKKFAIGALVASIPVVGWFVFDPNFRAIILWPDNIPINIIIILIAWLTWYALYRAAQNDERIERGECPIEATPENREKVWCWPNLVYIELMAMIGVIVFLVVWAIIFKAPLEEPANPTWAPNPAKAPWYFLGLQEMLVYFDPWMAGVVLPGIIVVGLIAIPYIDTNPKGNGYFTIAERPLAMWMFLYGWLVLWIYLIIVGTFLRGPNWTFYGPFEYWDFHKVVAEYNVNLSEFFWIKWLNKPMPGNLVVRELPGIILTLAYIGIIPIWSTTTKWGKKIIENTGIIRYYVFIFLLLGMTSLFSLKYIVALPEWELNL